MIISILKVYGNPDFGCGCILMPLLGHNPDLFETSVWPMSL